MRNICKALGAQGEKKNHNKTNNDSPKQKKDLRFG